MMSHDMAAIPNPNWEPYEVQVPQLHKTAASPIDKRSLQELLYTAKGRFVICDFLIGTQSVKTMSGFLANVGLSYFVLRDPCTGVETTCDIFSVKFISVYPEGQPETQSYCTYRLYRT